MCYWRSLIIEMIRHIAHLKDCFFYGAQRYKYVAPLEPKNLFPRSSKVCFASLEQRLI